MALRSFCRTLTAFPGSQSYTQSVGPGRTPWTGDQPVAWPLPTHRHPCLEWDSNTRSQPSSERRQVHILDRAAIVIGHQNFGGHKLTPPTGVGNPICHVLVFDLNDALVFAFCE
jgi:hypothetical protein